MTLNYESKYNSKINSSMRKTFKTLGTFIGHNNVIVHCKALK